MKTVPFWTDQYPRPAQLPVSESLPDQVDVAIVGSGYTGLNAARVLARNGATVAVLEQHTVGWGASSRNGGMATPGLKQKVGVIEKKYGLTKAKIFWKAALEAIDLLEEVIEQEQIECDWRRSGHLGLAYKASHYQAMQDSQLWMKQTFGYDARLVPKKELRSEIGTDAFFGGLMYEGSGSLHPAKYVFGLAQAVAARPEVTICEQTRVESLKQVVSDFEVHTDRGVLRAKEVLLATNGYTTELVPGIKRHIFPVGSYVIVTEPLPKELQELLSPNGRMFYDSRNFLAYFRLTPDGRMLWGGRNDLSTDLDLHDSAQRLREEMVRVFPNLQNVPLTHTWTGQLGLTFDLMPHVGTQRGAHYAFGYGGHGLSIATYVGNEVGKLMAGEIQSSPFLEIPQQTMFFYRRRPWFIPFAAMWYRFRDMVS